MIGYIVGGAVGTALAAFLGRQAGKTVSAARMNAIRAWVATDPKAPRASTLLDIGRGLLGAAGNSGPQNHGGWSGIIPPSIPIVGGKPFTVDKSGVTVNGYHAGFVELGADALTGGAVSSTLYAVEHPSDIPVVGDIIDIFS